MTTPDAWVMPAWMEPYRGRFANSGGNTIEDLINRLMTEPDLANNMPVFVLAVAARDQVRLLTSLHEAGLLGRRRATAADLFPDVTDVADDRVRVQFQLPETPASRAVLDSIRSGDLPGLSVRPLPVQPSDGPRRSPLPTVDDGGPFWRVVETDTESLSGVAPVCDMADPDEDVYGVYDCCPQPHLECGSTTVAAEVAAFLNARNVRICE